MGRKKIEIKFIENSKERKVNPQSSFLTKKTFKKRKTGLLKKAAELSILCGIDLTLIFNDLKGNIHQFSNDLDKIVVKVKSQIFDLKQSLVFHYTFDDYPFKYTKKEKSQLISNLDPSFEPLLTKRERSAEGFDDVILKANKKLKTISLDQGPPMTNPGIKPENLKKLGINKIYDSTIPKKCKKKLKKNLVSEKLIMKSIKEGDYQFMSSIQFEVDELNYIENDFFSVSESELKIYKKFDEFLINIIAKDKFPYIVTVNTIRYFLKCLFLTQKNFIRLSCKYLSFDHLKEIFDELVYLYSLSIEKGNKYIFSENDPKSDYHKKMLENTKEDPFVLLMRHTCAYFLAACSQKKPNPFKQNKKDIFCIKTFIMEGKENLKKYNNYKTLVMKKVLIVNFRMTTEKKFSSVFAYSDFKMLNFTSKGTFNFGLLDEELKSKLVKNMFLAPLHLRVRDCILFVKTVINQISSIGLGYKLIEDHFLTENGLKLYEKMEDCDDYLMMEKEDMKAKSEAMSNVSDYDVFKELVDGVEFDNEKIFFNI